MKRTPPTWSTINNVSPYREVDHTADWALHVWAPTLEGLFADAARGMYALTGAAPSARALGPSPLRRRIELKAEDYESLLVAWLQELLYHTESEGLVFDDFRIEVLDPAHLRAEASGGTAGQPGKLIKAATYHNLEIRRTAAGYEMTIVFDV